MSSGSTDRGPRRTISPRPSRSRPSRPDRFGYLHKSATPEATLGGEPRPSFPSLLGVGLQPAGSSPHRAKPRQRGCHPPAPVVGDPPSTAGLHGGGKGP